MPQVLVCTEFALSVSMVSDKARRLYFQISDGMQMPTFDADFLAARHNNILVKIFRQLGPEQFLAPGFYEGRYEFPQDDDDEAWQHAVPIAIVPVVDKYAIEVVDGSERLRVPDDVRWVDARLNAECLFPKAKGDFFVEEMTPGVVRFGIRGADFLDQMHRAIDFPSAVEGAIKDVVAAPSSHPDQDKTMAEKFATYVRNLPDGAEGVDLPPKRRHMM